MKKLCAWWQADLGTVGSEELSDNVISHGICKNCAARLFAGHGESLQEFLDRLGPPILLVESEPRVRTANKQARDLLGKELPEIENRMGGDVIECVYAKRPGGCGSQVHCKSCTIRNTVLETFATGKSFVEVPAYPDIQQFGEVKTMRLIISTEKIGNVVLLRIDDIGEKQEGQTTDPPDKE